MHDLCAGFEAAKRFLLDFPMCLVHARVAYPEPVIC